MRIVSVIFVFFVSFVAPLRAETKLHAPQARLPLMKTAPTIDGTVNDDEWAGAARMERFAGADGLLSPQEASFWVGCDGKELFIAVVSETPPGGKLLARVPPLAESGNARTWEDDSVELVLDPLHTDTSGRRRLYHANLNSLGAINDRAYVPGGGGEAWRGNWRTASKVIGDRWHFEIALPLADMKVTQADLANPFGIRVVRNWQQRGAGPAQTEWSPLGGAYLSPDTIPLVVWDAQAPVVQVLQLRNPDKLAFHTRIAIRNPRAEPLEVRTAVNVVPKNSAHTAFEKVGRIPAGETTVLDVPAIGFPNEELRCATQVTSPEGATVYFFRDFTMKLERPDPLWVLDADAAKKVDVKFAYFPYHDTIKAVVNVSGLEQREQVTGAKLSVRERFVVPPSGGPNTAPTKVGTTNGKTIATTRLPELENFTGQLEWKIPALPEGQYEFVVELAGVNVQPLVTEFARHVLPWEHNTFGKSDVIVEPFEPIRIERVRSTDFSRNSSGKATEPTKVGTTNPRTVLHTILRTHTLNNLGLWDQVESLGQPLLKAPMRLEVNGAAVAGKKLRFIEKRPTRVVTEARCSAGTTRTEWDYDGMMKWTLELRPSKEAINSMTLVIPLDDRLMPLFHAVTDGLRFNYAGVTPAGTGRVWDGSKAARNSIVGSYVPYIWLGAEERGFAVFGENDRGWVRDPKVPCQELVRNGDTLELRLNLISTPVVIDQPRRIVIGFQATPTKPMPVDWRSWNVNLDHIPETRALSARGAAFLGCCMQWGGLTGYDDIYPRDEDFRLYEKFAEMRRTGNADWKYMEKFVAETKLPNEAERESFRGNLQCGFHVCSTKPRNVMVYTNPRGMRHDTREGQTFLDEWHVEAFLSRKSSYGGGSTYGANPVESFRDFSLWYYRKMLETFVDAINWDNTYLKACFDTVGTDAYELSPGTIQPSVGLWNMRELIRRTAVLFHELKKRPMEHAAQHQHQHRPDPVLRTDARHLGRPAG